MILTFRPIKVWPTGWDPAHPDRRNSPFTAGYADTLEILDRELNALYATDVVLQVDAPESACRLDGQLRADAKVTFPGVILSFRTARLGALSYPCDVFGDGWTGKYPDQRRTPPWQNNLRAIALGLEALRKVDRYGIAPRGQQYSGWAELPAGIAMPPAMTADEAARLIAEQAAAARDGRPLFSASEILENGAKRATAYRVAAKAVHPDTGGDDELFRRLTEARDLLEAAS